MGPRHPLHRLFFFSFIFAASNLAAVWDPTPSTADVDAGDSAAADSAAVVESPTDAAPYEEPRYRLDPVVVTGERLPLRLGRVPLDVTVIGRGRLDTQRQFLLADAIREVPAINVQRSGNLGKLTSLYLRGADPRHTLVLFDGIPLNGPWLGSFDFADLMDTGVERVEVLGGPSSSLYGSGAVGGVIQVLSGAASNGETDTSPPSENQWRVFAEYGENVTLRQGVQWSGSTGKTPLGFSVTRLVSDGVGPRDSYLGLNGNAFVELPVGTKDRVRATGLATQGKKELPYDFYFDYADPTLSPFGSNKQIGDPNNDEEDFLVAGSALWTRTVSPAVALEGEISGMGGRIENENEPNGGGNTDFQNTDLRNSRGTAALRARVEPGKNAHVLCGADFRGDHVDRRDESNYGGFGDTTVVTEGVQSRALYAQVHAEPHGRVIADAGIRLDDHSRYGSYGLPRVAVGFLIPEAGVKLRAGYGRAFTAPSLTDLYYPGYSSTALRPERSTTWEAGIVGRWLGGRVEGRFGWHHTDFTDLIQGVLQPDFTFIPENVGEARIEGEEYSVTVAPSARIEISGSAAHLIATNLTTGDPLAKRPTWRFGVSGQVKPRTDLTLSGSWRWVDSVRDPFNFIDVEGRVLDGDNPGYAALDLGAIVLLHRWAPLDVNLRVTNVLDREYSEVKGFPVRGRAFTVGVTFTP